MEAPVADFVANRKTNSPRLDEIVVEPNCTATVGVTNEPSFDVLEAAPLDTDTLRGSEIFDVKSRPIDRVPVEQFERLMLDSYAVDLLISHSLDPFYCLDPNIIGGVPHNS